MLTKRMQIQVVADVLGGFDSRVKLVDLDEPWRTCYQAIYQTPHDNGSRPDALRTALNGFPNRDEIISAILAMIPGRGLAQFQSLEDIAGELPPIRWLWRHRVPRGMLTLLGAVPGAGKSLVTLDWCNRVIRDDGQFPDGTPVPRPGSNVVYVDAENVPQILNARAQAWRMDRRRIYMLLPGMADFIDLTEEAWRDRLVEMTFAVKPELIIVDSMSRISSKGENNVEDVRGVLGFLARLCADFDCGLILIHHLNKSGMQMMDMVSMADFRGSGDIVAAARVAMGISVVNASDGGRSLRLDVVKSNVGPLPDPIGIEIAPSAEDPETPVVRYGEAADPYREPSEVELCAEWMLSLLESGPMKPDEIVQMAKQEGYSRSTVYRARRAVGIRVSNSAGKNSPDNEWQLAS